MSPLNSSTGAVCGRKAWCSCVAMRLPRKSEKRNATGAASIPPFPAMRPAQKRIEPATPRTTKGGESDVGERERTAGADPLIEAQVRKDLSDPGAEHGDRETHGLGHGREGVVRLVQRPRRSVGVDDRDVFDAHAEAAGEVHARL